MDTTGNRFQWKRKNLTDEQIDYVKKAFTRPKKKDVAKQLGISIYVLDRILDELKLNFNPHEIKYEEKTQKERIRILYEETDLTLSQIVRVLHLNHEYVLTLLHEMYSDEQIKQRSARLYSKSKSGDNNPGRLAKKKTGHGLNFRGGQPCETKEGYLLVPNNGVLDKSDVKQFHCDTGDQTWVYQHQLVMLTALGLNKMPKGWNVHHIDKNTKNNNLNNLALMSAGAHARLHARERKLEKEIDSLREENKKLKEQLEEKK